jgi:ATP-dependent exoDNAse (exonuclease V) beta subunit
VKAPLKVIGASAGSGKTYRLTEEVTRAVDPSEAQCIAVEKLVAVTYTTRAASELTSRIRRTLIGAGATDRALTLPLAHVGTIHAVALRLLQDLAIDAGLAPTVDVLAGDATAELRRALESAIPPALRQRMTDLGLLLHIEYDNRTRRSDWLRPIYEIMDLARSNRIAVADLPAMAARSVDELCALLGKPRTDGKKLDETLAATLAQAEADLAKCGDTTKATAGVRDLIRDARRNLRWGPLPWIDWARLSKAEPGASARDIVAPLKAVASEATRHPRLHAEVRELVAGAFECARLGLESYGAWKGRRRVVDYVDMIVGALDLLEDDEARALLRDRFGLVVVDEFQDTSPIQLALFVKLHAIAGRSIWVGDRKQCIFEFASADPALMESIVGWAAARGAQPEPLSINYRSRPKLVDFTSELFARALAPHGFSRDEVVVHANRTEPKELAALPPLGTWWLDATNNAEQAEAIANGIEKLLAAPSDTPVLDRATGLVRDVAAGDVAVLVATNAEAEAIADALAVRGIRSAVARPGLLATPEGTLVDAALRLLLDPRDRLDPAVIEALHGFDGSSPDAWLEAKIAAIRAPAGSADGAPSVGWQTAIAALRERLGTMSPSEAVEAVIDALDAATLCARWPNAPQRLGNLDAVRGMAADYEERCGTRHEAASLTGLLGYFADAQQEIWDGEEERARDFQHFAVDPGAVVLLTYHRSKGLEWPVVVLSSLDRKPRRDAFGVHPESDAEAFDPDRPLAGRWIRYWPWPFGAQQAVPLADQAAQSPRGRAAEEQERKERARLLYVGFTRARDHLVIAARTGRNGPMVRWLNELADATGTPLLSFDECSEDAKKLAIVLGGGKAVRLPTRLWALTAAAPAQARVTDDEPRRFARPATVPDRPSYWIAPSRAAEEWPDLAPLTVGEFIRIHPPLAINARERPDWDVLGNAIHAFLAADVTGLSPDQRWERAERLLSSASLLGTISPASAIEASDALCAFVSVRWPNARWHREVPVSATVGLPNAARRVAGTIDLLLENEADLVIIDHKSFPAAHEAALRARAAEFGPQLATYTHAANATGSKRVRSCWIHFAVAGAMVALDPAGGK